MLNKLGNNMLDFGEYIINKTNLSKKVLELFSEAYILLFQ